MKRRPANPRRSSVRLESRRGAGPAIGLTPLIDVVFILLLFFMLASDLNRFNRIEVTAAVSSDAAGDRHVSIFLRVHADGTFSLVGDRLAEPELMRTIGARLVRHPELAVVVHPDGDVSLQALVDILERLTSLGVGGITLG